MRMYRVEHPATGRGPYTGQGFYRVESLHAAHRGNSHPSKGEEFPDLRSDMAWFCAFDSLDILAIWFEGFGSELISAGFEIVEYEISPLYVRHGKCQSIIRMDRAEKIRVCENCYI